jgi:hypothetical protein
MVKDFSRLYIFIYMFLRFLSHIKWQIFLEWINKRKIKTVEWMIICPLMIKMCVIWKYQDGVYFFDKYLLYPKWVLVHIDHI